MTEKPTYEELKQKVKKLEQEAYTHRQVEKILRESEQKYNTHIQNTPIGAISWDLNFKVIEWNPAAENIFSFSKVEAMGKHATELILPDEMKELVDSIFRDLLSEKGGTSSTNENITKNGRRIICDWYNTTLKDVNGNVIGVASLVHDITERIQVFEAFKKQKQFNEKIVQTSNAIIVGLDKNHKIKIFNRGAEKITGFKAKEVIGNDWFELFFKSDIYDEMNKVWESSWGVKSNSYVNPILSKNGDEKIISWQTTGIYNSTDETKHMLISIGEDISERIQAEELLKESEEKFRRIFDNLQDGYLWADRNGNILLANMVAANILGYDLQELMQKNMAQDIYFIPRERETVKEIMVQNGKIENYELTFKRKDGQKIIVEANSHLIYEDNQPKSMEGTFRDITSRKRVEEDRANLEEQLKQGQKMETIGTLAGGIAHDFNNILGSIIGYSELLKEDMTGNKTSKHFIDQILKGGNRAKELVEQILLFSRQSEHDKIQVEITPLVKEIKKMLTASLPSTIEFKMNILTTHDFVLADPTQIHQVLMNLCTNSAHAMGEKGGTLTIEIDQMNIDQDALKKFQDLKFGNYLKLQISDTGHGILPDVMDKVFDPFFSTKPRGEGTGLGLSVVHGIVKKCGGDIKAYSELGIGTTFIVLLPMIDKIEQKKSTENNFIPKGIEKILFVDDEQSLVDLGKMMLERLGYKVTAISDSQVAWHVFQKDPNAFDMVITDKTMPGLTGLELSKKVLGLCPEKPIIMCTGFGDEGSIKQAQEIGIRDYIHKPILNIKIAETIRKVFDQPDEGNV